MKVESYCQFALILALSFVAASPTRGQGNFTNLNFEAARLSVIPPGQFGAMIPFASGLPGWSGLLGTQQATQVYQNGLTLGNAGIDIVGPDWIDSAVPILAGRYSVILQAGDQLTSLVPATITQTGLIPAGTKSIEADFSHGASDFTVFLGGQSIAMVPLAVESVFTLFGGTVPDSMAGQTEELSISALPDPPLNSLNMFAVDSITFSPESSPEPSTWALLLCGAGAFAWNRWTKRR